jgi:hypothetical protein
MSLPYFKDKIDRYHLWDTLSIEIQDLFLIIYGSKVGFVNAVETSNYDNDHYIKYNHNSDDIVYNDYDSNVSPFEEFLLIYDRTLGEYNAARNVASLIGISIPIADYGLYFSNYIEDNINNSGNYGSVVDDPTVHFDKEYLDLEDEDTYFYFKLRDYLMRARDQSTLAPDAMSLDEVVQLSPDEFERRVPGNILYTERADYVMSKYYSS